jgi:hypothetical protein
VVIVLAPVHTGITGAAAFLLLDSPNNGGESDLGEFVSHVLCSWVGWGGCALPVAMWLLCQIPLKRRIVYYVNSLLRLVEL